MFGIVFASSGVPLAPWQAAHICALASMSAGGWLGSWLGSLGLRRRGKDGRKPAAMMVDTQRDSMVSPLGGCFQFRMIPVSADGGQAQ